MSDIVTKDSPARIIVQDYVLETAKSAFGDKYDYFMTLQGETSLEDFIGSGKKPRLTVILGDESTELFSADGTLQNLVAITGVLTQHVPTTALVHGFDALKDVETMKKRLVGTVGEHKGHAIYGDIQTEQIPNFSANHTVDGTSPVCLFRVYFSIILGIFIERK